MLGFNYFLAKKNLQNNWESRLATVNRWEKGVCEPNYEGQKRFMNFAKKMIFEFRMDNSSEYFAE